MIAHLAVADDAHNLRAFIFFCALVAALLLAAVAALVRTRYSPLQGALYLLNAYLCYAWWKVDIRGRLELPPGQGAVIALNHISSVDPFFIQLLPDRVVRWMVAREFIAHWSFGWFLRFVEVIPTNRTGIDAAAIRQAIRYASEGGLVGMLPEGRVNMTDRPMLPVRPGTAMVAMRAGVPIIPCHIAGVWYTGSPWSPFFFPARVRLRVGEPVDTVAYRDRPDEREAAEELTLVVVGRIARLGGWTGFQPRLATREWKPSDDELAVNMGAVARRPQDTRRCE